MERANAYDAQLLLFMGVSNIDYSAAGTGDVTAGLSAELSTVWVWPDHRSGNMLLNFAVH